MSFLQKSIDVLGEKIMSIKSTNKYHLEEISRIQSQIDSGDKEIKELENEINRLNKRNWPDQNNSI